MKTLTFFLSLFAFLGLALGAGAETVTLSSSETLAVPTAVAMEWRVTLIDAASKTMQITYRWLDPQGTPIQKTNGETHRIWICQDRPSQLVANCTGLHVPYFCCTGMGTGTNCDPGSTCFSDIFSFAIRSQDVGTKIGVGLRSLIWLKFKTDVLSAGNNGTFDIN